MGKVVYYASTKNVRLAALAQLDRVFGYEPKGQGFESVAPRQKSSLYESIARFFVF